jgi:energy-coupling factor transporter ATP-binding protein EcfA2
MKKIYVIEGPDGSGKSTLAKAIKSVILKQDPLAQVTMMHFGAPKMNPFVEYMNALGEWLVQNSLDEQAHSYLVIDRFHIGERVYGTMLRNNPVMTKSQLRAIDDLLDQLNAVKIFAISSNEVLWDTMTRRGDELFGEGDKNLVMQIADFWRTVMSEFDGWNVYDLGAMIRRINAKSFDEFVESVVM